MRLAEGRRPRSALLDPRRPDLVQAQAPVADVGTHLVSASVAFLRRLNGIIPPPRRHLVRYAGVFGPASKARPKLRALVPATTPDNATHPGCPAAKPTTPTPRLTLVARPTGRASPAAIGLAPAPGVRPGRSPVRLRRSPHRRGLRRRCQPHPQPAHQPRPPRRARNVCTRPCSTPGRARLVRPRVASPCPPRPPTGHRSTWARPP